MSLMLHEIPERDMVNVVTVIFEDYLNLSEKYQIVRGQLEELELEHQQLLDVLNENRDEVDKD